ncbi:MAG: DUF1573 domain-containing protein [Desulfatiglandales bacterium]
MRWKQKMAVSFLMFLLVVLFGYIDVSAAQKSRSKNPQGKSCPHNQEVKKIQGSKIAFMEDSFDFGPIPYNRKVTHTFHFKNEGTATLLLTKHAMSKVIEGC